ncbi:MAG TPA: alpha/beta hydrolase [Chitinophagaceae bacterium]
MKNKTINLMAILLLTAGLWSCKKEFSPNEPGALVPKTVDQDATLSSISVNGTQLHSEAFGNPADPMVVFLHGGPGGDYRNGINVKNLVKNNYYIVFYDQRGSGLSKRHPKDSYNIQIMLDDLTAVIQHYRTSPSQKVFLFGHSWGAMLSTAYINKYPSAVSGAILAEPGGFTWDHVKRYAEKSRRIKLLNEVTNDVLYPDQFLTGKENDHAILDYKLALSSAFTFAKNNDEGIEGTSPFWRNGAAVVKKFTEIGEDEGFDFTPNLRQFTTKVLFLYSENNKAYGESFAREISSAYPNVQLSRVNGTGHEMIHFKWDNVFALALPYLNSLR